MLVDPEDSAWIRAEAPDQNLLRLGGGGVERLRQDGTVAETMALFENCLPSQIVDHPPRSTVALDIVLEDTTEAAWEAAEILIAQGLPSTVAASALIGNAAEIAQRLEGYRALGLRDVILTAPSSRAPYDAVVTELLPLLRRSLGATDRTARIAGISNGPFEWHGAAL
ncbi:hypothetical protein AA21291_0103 [Swaminathania salitolerans LMG 21291]|nr:hypothetical protein AA21291_0103 [Swaminathania salitolerans LMG 21291]